MITHVLAVSYFCSFAWAEIATNAESAMTQEQTPAVVGHSVYKTVRASRSYTQIVQNKGSTQRSVPEGTVSTKLPV